MIVNNFNLSFFRNMWADSRLVNKQQMYCLCTRCKKTKIRVGETTECKRHDEFVRMSSELLLSAPVFACFEFEERTEDPDYIGIAIEKENERSLAETLTYIQR